MATCDFRSRKEPDVCILESWTQNNIELLQASSFMLLPVAF